MRSRTPTPRYPWGRPGPAATAIFALLVLAAVAGPAAAFSFEPITQDYATTGAGASHVFRVINTTTDRIAVRISVRPRRIEPDGTETQGKEADEFIVFPRQMLLEPGERRSVRVRWAGADAIDRELSYRIIAEQVPVDMGTDAPTQGGGIRLTYRYEGSIYVVPPGASAAIRVTGVERSSDGRALLVRVVNEGTRHAILSQASLTLTRGPDGGGSIELGPAELTGLTGENMLAASTRVFQIPVPDGLWEGPVYGTIDFDAQ